MKSVSTLLKLNTVTTYPLCMIVYQLFLDHFVVITPVTNLLVFFIWLFQLFEDCVWVCKCQRFLKIFKVLCETLLGLQGFLVLRFLCYNSRKIFSRLSQKTGDVNLLLILPWQHLWSNLALCCRASDPILMYRQQSPQRDLIPMSTHDFAISCILIRNKDHF